MKRCYDDAMKTAFVTVTLFTLSVVAVRASPGVGLRDMCRNEMQRLFSEEHFNQIACARCYSYIPEMGFKNGTKWKLCNGIFLCTECSPQLQNCTPPNFRDKDSPLYQTFSDENNAKKWESCCLKAEQCCTEMKETPPPNNTSTPYCPATWDGWTCFPDTEGGTVATQPCPFHAYYYGKKEDCIKSSRKVCLENGTWYIDWRFGKEFTVYDCGNVEHHKTMLFFSIILHSLSVLLLIPALVIFSMYKQLQVHRISLHKNLSAALLFYDISVIILDAVFMRDELKAEDGEKYIEENPAWCKIIYILSRYFRLCQYAWMFCEGYYLHKLIAAAFAEQKSLTMFYIVGWGLPGVFVSAYAILRAYASNHRCWIEADDDYEWITLAPGLICLCLNLVFLCNIIRVLVTKLRSTHANEPLQFRKAVRAVIVLFPLFGMHFLLLVYRQPVFCGPWEVYQYISRASDGLQGFFVALIFCYLNGEVLYLLKRSYDRYRLQRGLSRRGQESMAMTRMSVSTHMSSVGDSLHPKNGSLRKNYSWKASEPLTSERDVDD